MSQIMTAEAVLKAKDATGGVFGAVADKIRRMNAVAAQASRSAGMAAQRAKVIERANDGITRAQMTAAAMTARVLAPAAVAYAGAQSFKRFADTDMALTRIGITAEASDKEVADLKKSLRDLAFSTAQPFDHVAKGLESVVASGENLKDAMAVMPSITKTAQASGAEVTDIANTAVALKQSLNIQPEGLQRAFDILNTAGKSGKFELKDLARYMASIGPAAKAAGFQGEEGLKKLAATMETIRAGTGTSEEAADSMLNILQKMESTETKNKFEKMGVDLPAAMEKARKEGKNLVETFMDLAKVATKGDISKIPQLINDMQFARGTRALMTYGKVFQEVMDRINGSAGSTMNDLNTVLNRPKAAIDRMSESWDRLKESAGAAIEAMGAAKALNFLSNQFEGAADYWNKPAEERRRLDIEKNRRENIKAELDHVDQRIAGEEKAEREKTGPSWWDRNVRGVAKLPPLDDRLNSETLKKLRLQRFDLQSQLDAKQVEDLPAPLTADEVKKLAEAAAAEQQVPPKKGALPKRAPLPRDDPRGPSRLTPAVQGFDDENERRPRLILPRSARDGSVFDRGAAPVPNLQAGAAGGSIGPLTAQLTGSAEVKGEVTGKFEVTASSTLISMVENMKQLSTTLKGQLNANNGPGSTGKSSPDAAAPSTGTSGSW